jgi:DNA replication protein
MTFPGFPSGGRVGYTAIPNVFFSAVLPQITDIAELKVSLNLLAALYVKKGSPRYIARAELLQDTSLMSGLGDKPEESLDRGLELAAARGTFICIPVESRGKKEAVYLLNNDADRATAEKIRSGEIKLENIEAVELAPAAAEPPPDIYTLYEQNVGMLTPLIADELKDAEQQYKADWIRDAIKEAALHNKRSIKYILKILENWSVEGRSDGTYQRDTQKTDPDKYLKGKYGHIVKH